MINLALLSNDILQPYAHRRRLLYGPQLVDFCLGLCFERGRGQNPDTAVAEFNGSRTTTERDNPKPTEWSAKRNEVSDTIPKAYAPTPLNGFRGHRIQDRSATYLEKIQTSFVTSLMTVSLMAAVRSLLSVLKLLGCRQARLYKRL